mgnify:CR=1 FL=1
MANEAVLRTELALPIQMTVNNSQAIEKGAFLRLFDPRVASGAGIDLTGQQCAGIAAGEKILNDGVTTLAIYRDGVFDVHASGAVLIGDAVMMAEANDVMSMPNSAASGAMIADLSSKRIGTALEAATDNETFQIHLRI